MADGEVAGTSADRVVRCGYVGDERMGVYVRPDGTPAFTFERSDVRFGDSVLVGFADDGVRVQTARIDALRDNSTVRIGLGDTAQPQVLYRFGTGEVRARTGDRETVASVDSEAASVCVIDDIDLRVTRADHAEVRRCGTTFVLNPDTGRTMIACADGVAEVATSGALNVCCADTAWRATVSAYLVVFDSSADQEASVVWDLRTGDLEVLVCEHCTWSTRNGSARVHACHDCGAMVDASWHDGELEFEFAGLRVRWASGTLAAWVGERLSVSGASDVRVRWGAKDFVADRERVLVSDLDEDWYLTADGRLVTGASVVTADRAIDGTLELAVRSEEDDETAFVWARGMCLDDGHGMRTVLDAYGRVMCTPTSRADHSLTSSPSGLVTVTADSATVYLADAEASATARLGTEFRGD